MKSNRMPSVGVFLAIFAAAVVGISPASAEQRTADNTDVSISVERPKCAHKKYSGLSFGPYSVVSPETISVSRPTQVRPNEVFDVVITPGTLATGMANAGRLSYDIALPTNATLVSYQTLGEGTGFRAQSGDPSPYLTRVDNSRKAASSGNFLRLWGGQSAGPGDSATTSTSTSANAWDAGLVVNANRSYRFPPVLMRFRAPASGGGKIVYGLPGAGQSGNGTDASRNSLTFTEQYGPTSTVVFCGASASAESLASTQVLEDSPWKASATIGFSGLPAQIESGATVPVSAQINAPDAAGEHFAGTFVNFRLLDGTLLGTSSVNSTGAAHASLKLPILAEGESAATFDVFAEFSGGTYVEEASSVASTVEVVDKIWIQNERTPSITVVETAQGNNKRVSITSSVTGGSYPSHLQAQLYRNGQPLGEPRAVSAAMEWQDVVEMAKNDTFAVYQVRIVDLYEGDNHYFGNSSERTVLVPGYDPETELIPGFNSGSFDWATNLFADPFAFWAAMQNGMGSITGSLGQ